MIFFKNNLKALRNRSNDFADEIIKTPLPEDCEVLKTKNGDVTAVVKSKDNVRILLHSKYDPVKEARRAFSSFDKEPQILIIGGMGLGYYPQIAAEILPDTKIIVIEKDLSLFRLALENRDLTDILTNKNIEFIISEKGEEIIAILQELQTRNIAISIHRPSKELYPESYLNIAKLVNSFVNSREINIATLARFEKLWTRNILNNAFYVTKYKGIKVLFDKFKDVPVFIVAAGPSLKRNIKYLKNVGDKGVIIAVNTVFKRLVDEGIIPDIVMAVDPQDIISKYFIGVHCPDTILVTESTVSKKVISRYPGPILFTKSVFKMSEWLEGYSSDKGEIDIGGSVSTAAFGLAKKMGGNPVVFCGLDLAYPEGQTHFKGAYFEDNWLNESDKINTALTLYKKFMLRHEYMEIPSYFDKDKMIKTDRKFLMFLWWFENKFKLADFTVIDSTEGGAYKKYAGQIPLKEVIEEYCNKEINKKYFDNTIEENYIEKCAKLLEDMKNIINELKVIVSKANDGIETANKFYSLISDNVIHGKPKSPEIDKAIKKMDEIDNVIINNKKMSDIISLAIQRTINTVMHNFDSNLNELEKEHDELRIARQSIMLYESIKEASEFNILHFKRAMKRIVRELEN